MKTFNVKPYPVLNYWRVVIIIIMMVLVNLPVETRAEGCSCPELGNLLEDSRVLLGLKNDTLPMARGSCLQAPQKAADILWFGVALEDPVGGAVFALDCSGKVLGMVKVGSVVKMAFHPPLDDIREVVKVDYIAKIDQAYGLQRVAILAFHNKKVTELWSHDSFEANFVIPTKDGTETTYAFQFSPDGKTISVTGKKKIYPAKGDSFVPENITTQNLKPRRFCWEPRGMFRECGDQ